MVSVGENKSATKSQLAKLFAGLPNLDEAALDELLSGAQVVSLAKGQFVFHAGDTCKAFLILLDGNVRVQLISSGGREVTLDWSRATVHRSGWQLPDILAVRNQYLRHQGLSPSAEFPH